MAGRKIEVIVAGDTRQLEAALGKASASTARFGQKLTQTGKTLSRNVTLPIVAAGAAAGKMALSFDESMTHVQALTGATAKQTAAWGKQILELGPKIGVGPQELADSLYFVASSGAKVNQVLPITTQAAKAAAAGMGDAQTVAQLLTSAINAYGAANLSASQSADVLTAAIKVGKAEPADLAQNLGRVIPVAQAMGVTFAETAALVATLTNTGLDAAESVTGVRAVLISLIKPASQSKDEMKKLGFSVADLQAEVKTKGLLATLLDLKTKLGDNRTEMAKLFPNVRALTAFLALTGENAKNAAKNVDIVSHSTGAAAQAFKTASEGPAFQFHQSLAQIQATAIKLGNELVPTFNRILQVVDKVATAFGNLSSTQQNIALIGLGAAAALGPTLVLAGNLFKVAKALRIITVTAPAAAAATAGAETAATGAAVAFNPLLVVALGLAAAAYVSYTKIIRTTAGDEAAAQIATQALAHTHNRLSETISEGGKTAHGWNVIMGQAGAQARSAAGHIKKELVYALGNQKKILEGALRKNIANYVDQMRGVAGQASHAAKNLDGQFTPAQVRAYKAAATFARTAARLAAAINKVPSRKQIQLVISVISNLQTEALAPGMGPESNRQGPGGGYHPKPPHGPPGGTGQGKGSVVIHTHVYLNRHQIALAMASYNKDYKRHNAGRSVFA